MSLSFLRKESLFIVRTIRNTCIALWRKSTEFNMLKKVVQLGYKWLIGARQGRECAENLKYTEL
jgi:hypothetical protein